MEKFNNFGFLCLFVLISCTNAREQCLDSATKDIMILDQLITETERDIKRGYSIKKETIPQRNITFCAGATGNSNDIGVGYSFCTDTNTKVRDIYQPIDPQAAQARLHALQEKRALRAQQAEEQKQECYDKYPIRTSSLNR